MLEQFFAMFSYTFLLRAFIVGILVSLCAALLGTSLVLRRYSMIGDGLSHVGFGALAVATVLHASPILFTIPMVMLAAFLLLRISERSGIRGDAAIAMISTSALALGVMLLSLSGGMNTDINSYLFGSILSMNQEDVLLSVLLCCSVLILFVLFYHKIFAITFDETFARATGIRVPLYNMLTAMLTAVTIVLGMRMMGALLIGSLIIFPSLTAMRVCKSYRSVVLTAAAVSVGCFFIGLALSYLCSTPSGASVVIVNVLVFLLFALIGKLKTL